MKKIIIDTDIGTDIDDAFALKIAGSPFADSITSAFFAVHSHKYIDNPTFKLSFDREMQARAIPTEEKEHAFKYLEKLTEELSEKDAGWNPNMDEIVDVTSNADNRKPKTSKPFTGGGPAPEGERGGKGGAYMEGINRIAEDSDGSTWVLHDNLARCVDTGEVINDVEKIKDKFKNANVIELG